MILNDAETAALENDVQNIAAFFYLEPDVRLWLGFGNIFATANVIDPGGAEYAGFGEITQLPTFDMPINGAANRVDFSMSAVDGPVWNQVAAHDAENVKGKRASVGVGFFGPDWQLLGAPHWFANYTADYLEMQEATIAAPDQQTVRTLTLSCSTLTTNRRRAGHSYFSDNDQQFRYAGDLFCSLVARYATGFSKKWPTFPP